MNNETKLKWLTFSEWTNTIVITASIVTLAFMQVKAYERDQHMKEMIKSLGILHATNQPFPHNHTHEDDYLVRNDG